LLRCFLMPLCMARACHWLISVWFSLIARQRESHTCPFWGWITPQQGHSLLPVLPSTEKGAGLNVAAIPRIASRKRQKFPTSSGQCEDAFVFRLHLCTTPPMPGKTASTVALGAAPAIFHGPAGTLTLPELTRSADFFFVRQGPRQLRFVQHEIHYVESAHDTVIVHLCNTHHVLRSSLKVFAERLSPTAFIQVHRSYIVRLDLIASIGARHLTMDGMSTAIPISDQYRSVLMERLTVT